MRGFRLAIGFPEASELGSSLMRPLLGRFTSCVAEADFSSSDRLSGGVGSIPA